MNGMPSQNQSLKLIGEQKKVLLLPPKNAIQVKGVAGSGKTTVAIYRAKHLLQNYTDMFHKTSVVIFMYTNTLVGYVDYLVGGINRSDEFDHSVDGITVTNFHKWAL